MSETPTCCYCGETLLCCPWHRPDRELLERGYHYWCHQTRQEPGMLRAQIAALAAAHDAAMAEAERYCDECDRLMDHMLAREARWQARAEAAEAQLATAREDGARSMLVWLAERMPDCCVWTDSFTLTNFEDDDERRVRVFAAWQAHETKEGRGGD